MSIDMHALLSLEMRLESAASIGSAQASWSIVASSSSAFNCTPTIAVATAHHVMRIETVELHIWRLLGVRVGGCPARKREDRCNQWRSKAGAPYQEPTRLPAVGCRVIDGSSCIWISIGRDIGNASMAAALCLAPICNRRLPAIDFLIGAAPAASAGAVGTAIAPDTLAQVGVITVEIERGTTHSYNVRGSSRVFYAVPIQVATVTGRGRDSNAWMGIVAVIGSLAREV